LQWTHPYISGFDEMVQESDDDFGESGLKVPSVIRRVKKRLSDWLAEK
jgi:hypothetical protein